MRELVAVALLLDVDPADAHHPANDRFILSKGHAAPLLYAAYAEGWLDPTGAETKRRNLAAEGIWLGRLIAGLMPAERRNRAARSAQSVSASRARRRSAPSVAGSAARHSAAVRSSTCTASRSALVRLVTGNGRAYAGAAGNVGFGSGHCHDDGSVSVSLRSSRKWRQGS